MPEVPGQVGIAALHGSLLVSVELLGGPDVFAKARKKLLRGLLTEPRAAATCPDAVELVGRMLLALEATPVQRVDEGSVAKLHSAMPWGSLSAVGYRGTLAHALITAA